ncbi:methyl-accepting chemotaxis protein [Thermovenabulum sp.]|uniref:methyl-accepting chemotaxis protein n=1 Tax=Thermovenabulum sp. TaxID=3100335 RepID=UPI003C7E79EB
MKVGIIGAGRGGTNFLKTLLEIKEVKIVGICDVNVEAPGIKLAKEKGINTFIDCREILKEKPDVIIELTGRQEVRDIINLEKNEETHIIDSSAARLIAMLSEHQNLLNQKLSDSLENLKGMLKNLSEYINSLNDSSKLITKTFNDFSDSIASSMEDIKKTDDIIRTIYDITSMIKILGINASIEAARAGEHGKGFQVVAQEIGKLTNSSATATSNITKTLLNIRKNLEELSEGANVLKQIVSSQENIATSLDGYREKIKEIVEDKK